MAKGDSGLLPPLFERLAASGEAFAGETFDRDALADSVAAELLRLLNTRRPARPLLQEANVLDYGIADWTALQAQRAEDRRLLAREIRRAIGHFEPRLQLSDIDIASDPRQPQRLRVQLYGQLRQGPRQWPVAFVVSPSANGLEVRHERLD